MNRDQKISEKDIGIDQEYHNVANPSEIRTKVNNRTIKKWSVAIITLILVLFISIEYYINCDAQRDAAVTETSALSVIVPEKSELIPVYHEKRSLKHAAIGAGLFLSGLGLTAGGYVAKNTCLNGVIHSVFGDFSGVTACVAGIAVAIVCGTIFAALGGDAVSKLTAKRTIGDYEDLGNGYYKHPDYNVIWNSTYEPVGEQHGITDDLISQLADLGLSDLRVTNHVITANDTINKRDTNVSSFHGVMYEYDGYNVTGMHLDGTALSYFTLLLEYNENDGNSTVSKRKVDSISWALYNVASANTQQEEEAEGNSSEVGKNGEHDGAFTNWIDTNPGQKYCLQAGWTSNGQTFLKGELLLNSYGKTDGKCKNTI